MLIDLDQMSFTHCLAANRLYLSVSKTKLGLGFVELRLSLPDEPEQQSQEPSGLYASLHA